jgi:hypothetical protein
MSANRYRCEVFTRDKVQVAAFQETVGRRAVRDTRKLTLAQGLGAKGSVWIQMNGSVRWKLLHQCEVKRNGKLSWKGVEL